jgi:hypothetical protein
MVLTSDSRSFNYVFEISIWKWEPTSFVIRRHNLFRLCPFSVIIGVEEQRKHSHGFVLFGGSYGRKGQEYLAQGLYVYNEVFDLKPTSGLHSGS